MKLFASFLVSIALVAFVLSPALVFAEDEAEKAEVDAKEGSGGSSGGAGAGAGAGE